MPHCIVEHSVTLDGDRILPLVFTGALQSGLFEVDGSDIKVRSIAYQNYLTGGLKSDFVHVVLKILSGRASEQKRMLSALVLEKLQSLEMQNCSITIEVVDMDRDSYTRFVS